MSIPTSVRQLASVTIVLLAALAVPIPAVAKDYGPGVSDTEIKIGQTMPYSGPASAYGAIGRAEAAYFKSVNEAGGVNGRKINLISLDDAYSPPKTVEQVRRLVEQDEVLATFQTLGTPNNSAIMKYLNERKVPQLLVSSGANKFDDPQNYPYTTPANPSYQAEGRIIAKYILKNLPNAKIGVMYQNDDFGKDYLKGMMDGLGERAAKTIVAQATYEVSDPTVDSQILALKSAGADVFVNIATPKFAALAIRKVAEVGWKPFQVLVSVSASIQAVLKPAGFENSIGVTTFGYTRDPMQPGADKDPGVIEYFAWRRKYLPDEDEGNAFVVFGYNEAMLLVRILKQCGDDLTRENVIKQATHIDHLSLPMLWPGMTLTTTPSNHFAIHQLQPLKFDGERWQLLGSLIPSD